MITENNSIKTKLQFTKAVQWQLSKKMYISSLVALIISLVGIAVLFVADIVLDIFYERSIAADDYYSIMAILFLLFFVSLMLFIVARSGLKNAEKFSDSVNEYQFFAGHFIMDGYRAGVLLTRHKIFYNSIVRVKHTRDYLFLYNDRNLIIALSKTDLSQEELATILKYCGKPYDMNVSTFELPQNPAEDPFKGVLI